MPKFLAQKLVDILLEVESHKTIRIYGNHLPGGQLASQVSVNGNSFQALIKDHGHHLERIGLNSRFSLGHQIDRLLAAGYIFVVYVPGARNRIAV